MEYKDYYKILGVTKTSSDKEIKSSYRKLARKYHPDMNPDNPNSEAKFKEVNEAYEVLGDAEKRQKYNQLGSDWHRWQRAGRNPNDFNWNQWAGKNQDFNDIFGESDAFSDFFSSIFGDAAGRGQHRTQTRSRAGQDVEHAVEITLAEVYHGTTRILNKDGQRLEVKIPAGAKTGTKVRMRGKGQSGFNGGPTGDLYLNVTVLTDEKFERDGDNLRVKTPVDLYTAILGGEVLVPSMTGNLSLKIPAGSQNGRKFRLRGKGMPKLRHKDENGDLYAELEVRLPIELTPEQQRLFEQLREIG